MRGVVDGCQDPLLGEERLTSAMTPTPPWRRTARASIGSGTDSTRRFRSSSGTCACRVARSSRTPSMMSSSTLTSLRVAARPTLASTPHAVVPGGMPGRLRTTVNTKSNTTRRWSPTSEGHRELLAPPAPIGPQHVRHCGQRQDDQHGDGVEAQRTDNVTVQQIVSRPQASAEGQSSPVKIFVGQPG